MKKNFIGIIHMAVLCLLFNIFFVTVCQAEPQTIRVGWFTTDGGQFIDDKGNHSGYSYEYYQEIAKHAGWKYEYVDGTWDECLDRLARGEIDVVSFAQFTQTRGAAFDFSEQSMGKSYTQLTALADNGVLSQHDLANFNDTTIGALRGVTQVAQLERFAEEKNFRYQLQFFEDLDEMLSALENKKVDMVLHHSARRLGQNEKAVAKFAPQPFYFIVKKGNQALLKQIDQAMTEIEINDPNFALRLTGKYYASNAVKSFILTQQEKDFLKSLPVLRVVTLPASKPISAIENGVFTGINADILKEVTTLTGIEYQLIPTESYTESLQIIKEGKADLVCAYFSDYSWAEQNNVMMTSPFIECQYSMVKRRETMLKNPTVAAVKDLRFNEEYILANYAPEAITWYDSVQECFDAVNAGKQDITFTMTYTAENYLREYQYGNLMAFAIPYSHYISFATSVSTPLMLNSILDKALASLGKDEIQKIVASHTVFQAQSNNFKGLVYRNPVESVVVLTGIILIASMLFYFIVRSKSRHNQEMKALLYTDEVTGRPNYRSFKFNAGAILAADQKGRYALLYTDIQKFKYINDTLGHVQGDIILGKVMQQITACLEKGELCARVYADHFAALIQYDSQANLDRRLAESLMVSGAKTFQDVADKIIFRTGIYLLPGGELNIEKAVDLASYAKDSISYVSENTHVYYDEKMRTRIQEEKELEGRMHRALADGEFEAYFQPRVDVYSKKVVGAEALVRWNHPDKGCLEPGKFIPFFEKNGFITKLDLYMFEQVCIRQRELLDCGKGIVPVSSNFSRHHLNRSDLPDTLLAIAGRYGIPTNMLEVEITETVATYNFELAVELANKLKEYGFLIAIDDFGSGYSSIQLLYKLPLDVLKIDKDYTQNEVHNKIETAIVTSLVEITHGNGIAVVFEGIENQAQEDLVKSHHCRFGQGYYYARPIRFSAFQEKLEDVPR